LFGDSTSTTAAMPETNPCSTVVRAFKASIIRLFFYLPSLVLETIRESHFGFSREITVRSKGMLLPLLPEWEQSA